MRGEQGDKIRLLHILEAIEEIESYISNIELPEFESNSMMRFACIKQIEIVGEASHHLTDEIKNKQAHVQWKQINGLRNILIHEYFGVDTIIVWQIIKNDLPELKAAVESILHTL